jgi:hypothetical protein
MPLEAPRIPAHVIPAHDCMEEVRQGTCREAGLGHAGVRATQEKVRLRSRREAGLGHAKAEAGIQR